MSRARKKKNASLAVSQSLAFTIRHPSLSSARRVHIPCLPLPSDQYSEVIYKSIEWQFRHGLTFVVPLSSEPNAKA